MGMHVIGPGPSVLPRAAFDKNGSPLFLPPGNFPCDVPDKRECKKCGMDDEPWVSGWMCCRWCWYLIRCIQGKPW